jgi:hypothetical protein
MFHADIPSCHLEKIHNPRYCERKHVASIEFSITVRIERPDAERRRSPSNDGSKAINVVPELQHGCQLGEKTRTPRNLASSLESMTFFSIS